MHEYVLWETQEKYGSELNPSEEKEKSLLGNIISCPWDRCSCVPELPARSILCGAASFPVFPIQAPFSFHFS